MNDTTLYILSGLPGSGKTTLAHALARRTSAAYLRIDTFEQTLRDLCNIDVQGEGYGLAYRVASDILDVGSSVIADSCNTIELTRDAWRQVARESGARPVDIEIVCSDAVEHRHRVETRTSTVPGLRVPTWQRVLDREYHAWTHPRIVIDTAGRSVEDCLEELLSRLHSLS